MSLKAGDWYQNPLSVARRVSAVLGLQGRAVYDALCSYADNDTGETTATAETIAEEFQMSAAHARRIIRDLRNIRAIVIVTRGDEKAYRINREHPEALLIEQESREHGCAPRAPMRTVSTGARAPVIATRTNDQRNKEELDLKSKPTSQGVVISPEVIPPNHDDFCSSVAAAQSIMLPLGVSGPSWLDTLTGAVDVVITAKRFRRRDACDFLLAQWALYSSRHGPGRKKFWFSDGEFMDEGNYGEIEIVDTSRINRTTARNVGNAYAAEEAVRILRERRAEAGRDSRGPVPSISAHQRDS